MGIDYSGGMIVGAHGSDISLGNEDVSFDWAEDNGLDYMCEYFDADEDGSFFGYRVPDVDVSDIDNWLADVKLLGERFEKLTGTKAKLIGTQHIW